MWAWKPLIAETMATFMLCFVGAASIMSDAHLGARGAGLVAVALAHGIILSIAVTATMNISGAHINPAVTLAMWAVGRIKLAVAGRYIAAQLLGALLAGLVTSQVVFAAVRDSDGKNVVASTWNGTPHVNVAALVGYDPQGVDAGRAVARAQANISASLIEVALTFVLMLAIYGTAIDPRHPNVGGFGIGLAVTALILAAGPLTGAAMNPARFMGTGVYVGGEFWSQLWVYWVGPVAGALMGAFTYEFLVLEKPPTPQRTR